MCVFWGVFWIDIVDGFVNYWVWVIIRMGNILDLVLDNFGFCCVVDVGWLLGEL